MQHDSLNPLMVTLKPQNNGPLYSTTVIGTLAVNGWAATPPCPLLAVPKTKCNSPPINGQRTNFVLFDVAL